MLNDIRTQKSLEQSLQTAESIYSSLRYSDPSKKFINFLDKLSEYASSILNGNFKAKLSLKSTSYGRNCLSFLYSLERKVKFLTKSLNLPFDINVNVITDEEKPKTISYVGVSEISKQMLKKLLDFKTEKTIWEGRRIITRLSINFPNYLINEDEFAVFALPVNIQFISSEDRRKYLEYASTVKTSNYQNLFWENLLKLKPDLYNPLDWKPKNYIFVAIGKIADRLFGVTITESNRSIYNADIWIDNVFNVYPTDGLNSQILELSYSADITPLDSGNVLQAEAEADFICYYGKIFILKRAYPRF